MLGGLEIAADVLSNDLFGALCDGSAGVNDASEQKFAPRRGLRFGLLSSRHKVACDECEVPCLRRSQLINQRMQFLNTQVPRSCPEHTRSAPDRQLTNAAATASRRAVHQASRAALGWNR